MKLCQGPKKPKASVSVNNFVSLVKMMNLLMKIIERYELAKVDIFSGLTRQSWLISRIRCTLLLVGMKYIPDTYLTI